MATQPPLETPRTTPNPAGPAGPSDRPAAIDRWLGPILCFALGAGLVLSGIRAPGDGAEPAPRPPSPPAESAVPWMTAPGVANPSASPVPPAVEVADEAPCAADVSLAPPVLRITIVEETEATLPRPTTVRQTGSTSG